MRRSLPIICLPVLFSPGNRAGNHCYKHHTSGQEVKPRYHHEIAIIPEPVSIVKNTGHFILPENVTIQAAATPGMKAVVDHLQPKAFHRNGKFCEQQPCTKSCTDHQVDFKQQSQ